MAEGQKFFSSGFRSGAWRARKALIPAATSAIAAVAAYAFAAIIFGHSEPYFAATSALISLGFGRDPHIRKALEVAIGVTLGILVGDTLQALLGQGYWQGVIVVFVTIILARFIDSGVIFTTQMSIQAVLVVLLPHPRRGATEPFGGCRYRWGHRYCDHYVDAGVTRKKLSRGCANYSLPSRNARELSSALKNKTPAAVG